MSIQIRTLAVFLGHDGVTLAHVSLSLILEGLPLQNAVDDILMSLNSRQNFLQMFCIGSVSEKVSLDLIILSS